MDDHEFKAARRRVIRRYVLRFSFVFNLVFFLLMLALIITEPTESPQNKVGGAAAFAMIWGTFLLMHGIAAFNLFGGLIDRAARREMEQYQVEEKPKRSRMEIGEDGELTDVIDEWDEVEQKSKNSAASG